MKKLKKLRSSNIISQFSRFI